MLPTPLPIAIIADAATPYRIAYHLRVARELPQYRLLSVFTHAQSNAKWSLEVPKDINPHFFGQDDAYAVSPLKTALKDVRKAKRVARLLTEQQVAVVVINGYGDFGRLWLMRWCRSRRIPYFIWGDSNARGDLATGLKRTLKQLYLRRILGNAAGALCCGSLGQEYFQRYSVPSERIFWLPYEPDYKLIEQTSEAELEAVRSRFSLKRDRRRIVFTGRLAAVKRADLLIDAFITIAPQRPQWDLLIIGDGPLGEELKTRVPAEWSHRVIWTGFIDDQARVSALYKSADVLVLPSDYEPWALVINEAVASGLAVVASDVVGAAAELVRDGVNGYQFAAGNKADLEQKLLQVTGDGIDGLKANSATVLAAWREKADPVVGLAAAVEFALAQR
ncbi:MAG TPA: glycosyltransferase family 4 protein [Tepidisphaeraceae bacterium]